MKDVLLPLRIAYMTKLTGLSLAAYEEGAVPAGALKPYVIISTQTSTENSNKTDFGSKATTLLDIVDAVPLNQTGGSKKVDEIAGQIFSVINSKTVFIINDDFQNVGLKVGDTHNLKSQSSTHRIFRRLIRFEHIIRQLN